MTVTIPQAAVLVRREIPSLRSHNMRIAREGQLKRSWPVAPHEFFRIFKDEPLVLEVEFLETHPAPQIRLYTNLLSEADEWSEIEFQRRPAGPFSLSLTPPRCGIFLFKIKHSADGGKTWFWDRIPFSKVIVDPAGAKDIRMYTLIPNVSGRIGDWIAALDHVRDLGFNMVHLLPVTAMDASESPYAAADLFAIDPSFLAPDDVRNGLAQFEDFVRAAREKGIRLCLDLVLNHIGITSQMAGRCPEWIVEDKNEPNGLMRAGCWHMNKWIKWGDLCRIHYDHPEPVIRQELWAYMKQYALFWANYAAYTGGMIRLDNLHSSHPEFIADLIGTLRLAYPDLIIQAEFFSDSNTLLKTAARRELNLLLADAWEHPFAEALRDYLIYLHAISTKLRFLTPISTHDTSSAALLYGSPAAAVTRYFTLALFATGQMGMVQGMEHGLLEKIHFIGRNRVLSLPSPDRYSALIGKVNRLLADHALFQEGGNIRFVDQGHGAVLAALREGCKRPEERFLLLANLDTTNPYQMKLDLSGIRPRDGSCLLREMLQGEEIALKDDVLALEIEPCGMRAYRIENR
ncbi:MAG: alpha-amylase family glycosyl hydrolase [Deltaproteobacteria bacterium]|nr:alpha-amylase family glycosyl hydrolase [Deltaproteobacteria bacterium]